MCLFVLQQAGTPLHLPTNQFPIKKSYKADLFLFLIWRAVIKVSNKKARAIQIHQHTWDLIQWWYLQAPQHTV